MILLALPFTFISMIIFPVIQNNLTWSNMTLVSMAIVAIFSLPAGFVGIKQEEKSIDLKAFSIANMIIGATADTLLIIYIARELLI